MPDGKWEPGQMEAPGGRRHAAGRRGRPAGGVPGTRPWAGHMKSDEQLADKVEAVLAAPIADLGVRLLDVEYRREGGWVLRLVIDGEQGVTLDHCSAVSKVAGDLLEERDLIGNEYSLEVTSPGLNRPLRKPAHYRQSVGRDTRFRLAAGHLPERRNRTVRGIIASVGEESLTVDTEEGPMEIPFAAIHSARLDTKI